MPDATSLPPEPSSILYYLELNIRALNINRHRVNLAEAGL